jgi:hypothetical protein
LIKMSLHIVLLSCNGSYLISKVPKMTFFPTHTHPFLTGAIFALSALFLFALGMCLSIVFFCAACVSSRHHPPPAAGGGYNFYNKCL